MIRPLGNLLQAVRRRPWRTLLISCAAIALLGWGAVYAGKHIWARQQVSAAEQALARNDLLAARIHLDRARSLSPGNDRAQLLAIQTTRRLDDYVETERLLTAFEQAKGATPDSQREWLLLTVQQGNLSREPEALALLEPERPDAWLVQEAIAKGYMNTARWAELVQIVDSILQRDPDQVLALVLRAKARENLRQADKALEDYHQAVELAPDSTAARLGLAEALSRHGDNSEATHHFEILRERLPTDPAVLLGLARCQFDAAELDKAQETLEQLLAAQPDHVAGLVELGRLELLRSRLTEAEGHLTRATQLAPWHREGHRFLLSCLEELGHEEAARRCRQRIQEMEADDAELGRISLRYRDSPRDPAKHLELGMWLLRNGQDEMGRRWLFSALGVSPLYRPAHTALADYFDRTGQTRSASLHRRLAGGTTAAADGVQGVNR